MFCFKVGGCQLSSLGRNRAEDIVADSPGAFHTLSISYLITAALTNDYRESMQIEDDTTKAGRQFLSVSGDTPQPLHHRT